MRAGLIAFIVLFLSVDAYATPAGEFIKQYRLASVALKKPATPPSSSGAATGTTPSLAQVRPLMEELRKAAADYKQSVEASRIAGKPRSCPPKGLESSIDELLADIERLPAEWRAREFSEALAEAMDRRYPCGTSLRAERPTRGAEAPEKLEDFDINIVRKVDRKQIPFELINKKILFNAKIAGNAVTVLLDNGSTWTVIDPAVAQRLNLQLDTRQGEMQIGSSRTSVRSTVPATFEVPHTFSMRLPLVIFDLSTVSKRIDRTVDVVLGNDFLKHIAFVVDARHRMLSIIPTGKIVTDPKSAVVPIVNGDHIETVLNGKNVLLRIDFGSDSFVQLSNAAWDRVMPAGLAVLAEGNVMSADGSLQKAKLATAKFGMGGVSSGSIPVSSGYVPTDQAEGLLGASFLLLAPVALDGPAKQLTMFMGRAGMAAPAETTTPAANAPPRNSRDR